MATNVVPEKAQSGRADLQAKPLDEAAWQAWKAKGRASDLRDRVVRSNTVKLTTVAVLLLAAGLWFEIAEPYTVAVRFLVTAGAIFAMFEALQARHYGFSAAFGALVVLYNPLVSVLGVSGEWQRAFLAASTFPFVLSLLGRKAQPVAL